MQRTGEQVRAAGGTAPASAPPAPSRSARRADAVCVLALLVVTLAVYAPALFAGRVLLPADIVQIMPPWAATAKERYPDLHYTQNQMHGPIFEYYSWRHYARERLRAGEVPLWNPDELSGNVLLANNQSAVLYPPNILLYLLPIATGINLVTALHTFLTGLMMFGLLRALGLRPTAALTGAFAWAFGGLMVVWTEFQTPTAALCWLPGALWAWERYAQGRGWRWAVLGGGTATALALLAGHLQFAFYVVTASVVYAVVRTYQAWRTAARPRPLASVGLLAAALGFGIVLSMATTLPVFEMGHMNFRAARPDYQASIALRLPPVQLLMFVQPNMFGNPRDYVIRRPDGTDMGGYEYFGAFEYIEYTAYVGIPALILALFGVASLARWALRKPPGTGPHPALRVLLAIGLLGLLLALGTPVCALFVYGVPGYRQFNATARALCLVAFALAALAGFGLEALARAREERSGRTTQRILVACTGAILLALALSYPAAMTVAAGSLSARAPMPPYRDVYAKWQPYEMAGLLPGLVFGALTLAAGLLAALTIPAGQTAGWRRLAPAAAAWLLPVLALADLLVWGRGFNPMPPADMLGSPTEVTSVLRTTPPARTASIETPRRTVKSFIVPNFNAVVGYREVQGADSLHTRRYHLLAEGVLARLTPPAALSDPNTIHFPSLAHPVFDMLNVRYATTMPDRPAPGPGYRPMLDSALRIWENDNRPGPLWVVGSARQVAAQAALASMLSAEFDARREALVEVPGVELDAAAGGSPARLLTFSPHRLAAEVDSAGRGLAVFSEMAFPGWRAAVDGAPARLLTADYVLRAVPVPPGRHRIELRYDPTSYRFGLYLTGLALAAAAAMICGRTGRRATGTGPA